MKSNNNDHSDEGSSVVGIDEHHLDRECVRLPTDYLRYATRAAESLRDVDEMKAQLSVLEADLDRRIRQTPGSYGIEKVTETCVKNTIQCQKSYKEMEARVAEKVHESKLNQAVVNALEIKKRTLTLLVELHGMGYFATPKVSPRGREAVKEMMTSRIKPLPHRED